MAETTKIKACPHCGGMAYLTQSYSYKVRKYMVFVKCEICGSQGKLYTSNNEPAANEWNTAECSQAVSAWNMRTGEE